MGVDNVVHHWLFMTVEDGMVILYDLGHAVGRTMRVFYADDGIIGSQETEWFQGSPNVLISLFC